MFSMKNNKLYLGLRYLSFKYFLDQLVAFWVFVLIFPFLLFISFLILIILGKPIFFIQKRPGYKCKPFNIIKFRTMKNLYNIKGDLEEDKFRINKFGQFLRSTSIDELPALINIIKGEMSFVGPRPLLMKYLSIYNEQQIKRHDLKPGLTGLAQINGRNSITWKDKFEYDLNYIKHISFFLDLKIIFLTIIKVFLRKDINSKNIPTAIEFNGKN